MTEERASGVNILFMFLGLLLGLIVAGLVWEASTEWTADALCQQRGYDDARIRKTPSWLTPRLRTNLRDFECTSIATEPLLP